MDQRRRPALLLRRTWKTQPALRGTHQSRDTPDQRLKRGSPRMRPLARKIPPTWRWAHNLYAYILRLPWQECPACAEFYGRHEHTPGPPEPRHIPYWPPSTTSSNQNKWSTPR